MTGPSGFDRTIADWLAEAGAQDIPSRVYDAAFAEVRRTRRARPLPHFITRFLPMINTFTAAGTMPRSRPLAASRGATVILALALLGLALIGVGLLSAGVSPAPTGAVRNGLIAFDASGDIWVAGPDGSEPHRITSGPGVDVDPMFSPDGTKLAYWSLEDPSPESPLTETRIHTLVSSAMWSLIVVDPDGSHPITVSAGRRPDLFGLPASWSPDSRRLVYGTMVDEESVLEVASVNGGDPTQIATGDAPSWSPDGSLIAYRGADSPRGVMVVAPDGIGPRRLTSEPGDPTNSFALPQWSPDSAKLAYFSGPDTHDIWLVNADGSDEHRITTGSADEFWPYWSPDGAHLAFMTSIGNPPQAVGRYNIVDEGGDGRSVLDLTSVAGGAPTIWSPDSTMLMAFLTTPIDGMEPGVVLLNADGTEPLVVASIPADSPWNSGTWQRMVE